MQRFFERHALVLIATVGLVVLLIVRSLQDYSYPPYHTISDFPILTQPDDITCGPTSVAMVLKKYNIEVTIDEVKKVAKTELFTWNGEPIGGTGPQYIEAALKHFGVDADMKGATLERLKYYVSQDRPCIVLVRSGISMWHYVVVIGYSEKHIEVADPAGERYKMPTEHFVGAWSFKTDMEGNEMSGELADLLFFLTKSGEAREQTLIVPLNSVP